MGKDKKEEQVTHPETGPLGFITENDGKDKPEQTIPSEVSNEVENFTDEKDEDPHK